MTHVVGGAFAFIYVTQTRERSLSKIGVTYRCGEGSLILIHAWKFEANDSYIKVETYIEMVNLSVFGRRYKFEAVC